MLNNTVFYEEKYQNYQKIAMLNTVAIQRIERHPPAVENQEIVFLDHGTHLDALKH